MNVIYKKALGLGSLLLFTSLQAFAAEVSKIGDNWTRYVYSQDDFVTSYGSRLGNLWKSGLNETIRHDCMIKTTPLFIAGDGEIDVRIIHRTNAYAFARNGTELTGTALFGVRVEDEQGAVFGEVVGPGSAVDWLYNLHSGPDDQGNSFYNLRTNGTVSYRISKPIDAAKDHNYRVGICPVLEMTDVGIEKVIIDVRLSL
jgi:hypothetical protein